MSKAEDRVTTLANPAEVQKVGELTPIRKLAAEMGEVYDAMEVSDEVEFAAKRKKESADVDAGEIAQKCDALIYEANILNKTASDRSCFLKEAIVNTAPVDSVDAMILLLMLRARLETGENYVAAALEAKTQGQREAALEENKEDHVQTIKLLDTALFALFGSLGFCPKDIGLSAFWIENKVDDLPTALKRLTAEAARLSL